MHLKQHNKLVYLLLFIPPLLWVIYRSYALDITHDEAWSFHMVYKQLYHSMFRTANNHWLNSFFMFFEHKLLGTEVWQIRLHSVLAFVILSYYLYKIVVRLPNKWWGYTAIILITYNTYILDFFSIARGYALGLAFAMGAIYYILYQAEGVKNRLRIYGLLCLAATSVYTELYLLMAYGLYELGIVFKFNIFNRKQFIKYVKPLWLPAIFLSLATRNILLIKEFGDLNEGRSNGFFVDTLGVFFERAFEPFLSTDLSIYIGVALFLVFLIAYFLLRNRPNPGNQLTQLLLIAFLIHYTFFYGLDVPFPFGRTALYFVTPFLLCICLLFSQFHTTNLFRRFSFVIFLTIYCSHLAYALTTKNIHTTQEWWMGQGVGDVVEKIGETEKRNLDNLSILYYEGHNGDYQNYYMVIPHSRIIRNLSRIHPFSFKDDFKAINENPNTFDYILLPDYDSILNATIHFDLYDSIQYYPDMKTWLLKKKY